MLKRKKYKQKNYQNYKYAEIGNIFKFSLYYLICSFFTLMVILYYFNIILGTFKVFIKISIHTIFFL